MVYIAYQYIYITEPNLIPPTARMFLDSKQFLGLSKAIGVHVVICIKVDRSALMCALKGTELPCPLGTHEETDKILVRKLKLVLFGKLEAWGIALIKGLNPFSKCLPWLPYEAGNW